MIKKNDVISGQWKQDNLSWHMEEIVCDFICLADDIIEDLCKDVPVQSNYQRYHVAHSLGYERSRWKKSVAGKTGFISSSRTKFTKVFANPESERTRKHSEDNVAGISYGESELEYCRDDDSKEGISPDSQDADIEVKVGESWDFLCTPYRNVLHTDRIARLKLDPSDPIILNYEVLSQDANGNEAEITGNNNKMKIKIELLKQPDMPTIEAVKVNDLSVESKTTKMKVRLPKRIFDTGNQEEVNEYVVNCLRDQLNSGVLT
ncbi:uncharacterized protein LOC135686774 [Rhopilema esculentum]|uniref:uncharacterized protein LOC135686774 n=1 Tax=Rhopilema esculentum TaxID=499914 RepID=UPI0031E3F47A